MFCKNTGEQEQTETYTGPDTKEPKYTWHSLRNEKGRLTLHHETTFYA